MRKGTLFLTVGELIKKASEHELAFTRREIYSEIKDGNLKAIKKSGKYFIDRQSAKEFLKKEIAKDLQFKLTLEAGSIILKTIFGAFSKSFLEAIQKTDDRILDAEIIG